MIAFLRLSKQAKDPRQSKSHTPEPPASGSNRFGQVWDTLVCLGLGEVSMRAAAGGAMVLLALVVIPGYGQVLPGRDDRFSFHRLSRLPANPPSPSRLIFPITSPRRLSAD